MRGGLALALCLQIVAANDDKTKCPGNGKPPKRHDRLTRLAEHYNGDRCKAAILAEDLPRWISTPTPSTQCCLLAAICTMT